jgi:PIN domain nuclease of toxin-antitoxin system
MLNLDTHILVQALSGDLTPAERRLLSHEPWSISAIVVWEVTKLSQLDRISLDIDSPEFARAIENPHLAAGFGRMPGNSIAGFQERNSRRDHSRDPHRPQSAAGDTR